MTAPDFSLACTEAVTVRRFLEEPEAARAGAWLPAEALRHGEVSDWKDDAITRIHLGNEFCERLLPEPETLAACLAHPRFALSLTLPILSDQGMKRVLPLLDALPSGHEVIVNEWGALRLLRRSYPNLKPIAGRLLCKQIKDPRLPSPEWASLYPSGIYSEPFAAFLMDYGISRMEVDIPPHVHAASLNNGSIQLSAHLGYGYVMKGRMCKIGSLNLPEAARFQPGHGCGRECLDYVEHTARPTGADLRSFQRGNTRFYVHDRTMWDTVYAAAHAGWVDRLIIHGDWHEDRRPH